MLSSRAVILFAAIAYSVLGCINKDYSDVLNGLKPIDEPTFDEIFQAYKDQFAQKRELTSKFLANSNSCRKAVFARNLAEIVLHNKDATNTWKKGINAYSDMTHDEFRSYHNLVKDPQADCSATHKGVLEVSDETLPAYWDWRNEDGVTPVKDQGNCGSCWTFSTVGTLEAHYLIKYGVQQSFSEQQLIDCAGNFDNYGCNGGLPSHAFEYINSVAGLQSESDYPYTALTGPTCNFDESDAVVSVHGGAFNITVNDEDQLAKAVFLHGPVSICFEVVDGFDSYVSGVYTSTTCGNTAQDVNHAVVAIGYGTDPVSGLDFWIVKNSWGTDWGNEGYFWIERGVNMCGVAQCNSFPIDVTNPSSTKEFLN